MIFRLAAQAALAVGAVAAHAQTAAPAASGAASAAVLRWARAQVDDPACAPVYPAGAARPDRPIRMIIAIQVDAIGRVSRPQALLKAAGYADLQAAVVDAVARCPVAPGRDARGQAVAGTAWITWTWEPRTAAFALVAGLPALIVQRPVCTPDYPDAARFAGATGLTVLRVSVNANGWPTGSEIVKSAGTTPVHKMLDEETRKLTSCAFLPARDGDGAPIAGTADVETNWKLL